LREYINGIIRDHEGNAIGARKEVVSRITQIEPIKSIKKLNLFKVSGKLHQ
jgi:hypothetical protein